MARLAGDAKLRRVRIGSQLAVLGFLCCSSAAAVAQSPSPSATPAKVSLVNISARAVVDPYTLHPAIAGFIITGNTAKRIVLRGLGPSAWPIGRYDPYLYLYGSEGTLLWANNNYKDDPSRASVEAAGLAPPDDLEAAMLVSLVPGSYTAVLRSADDRTFTGLVEIYDLDAVNDSIVGNLSARAWVVGETSGVLIGGTILQGGNPQRILFRAIGPSLAHHGVAYPLPNPTIELHDSQGALLVENDDWRQAANASEIAAIGIAPENDREGAILMSLPAGSYTAVVRSSRDETITYGEGLVEIYHLPD